MGLKIKSTTQDLFDAGAAEEGQIYQVIKSEIPRQIGMIVIRNCSNHPLSATLLTCLSTGDTWNTFPRWKLMKLKKGTTLVVE